MKRKEIVLLAVSAFLIGVGAIIFVGSLEEYLEPEPSTSLSPFLAFVFIAAGFIIIWKVLDMPDFQ